MIKVIELFAGIGSQRKALERLLEADLKNHALNYNDNPIIKWCLANIQTKADVNGNIQSSKLNSRLKRIDGTVPTIIAYATLTKYKLDYESVVK